ncbi:MAG: thiM [Herbinix sp.]|jgi:hydroxyethylthiazole kinase|nr:thiM [Herbinix sp.]
MRKDLVKNVPENVPENIPENMIENVREKSPYIHCITNYVTVNDCANILLACGASPIMADDVNEVEDITSICNALVINTGTLNERTISSMIKAGQKANALKHPIILDPVGAGASKLRTETVERLLREIKFDVIRGNASEIKCISKGVASTKGVDADQADYITEDNIASTVAAAKALSERTGAIIAITGAIDIVADASRAYVIRNGNTMMSRITGTGCMLTAVIGAMCAANLENLLEATATGVSMMGICGEIALQKLQETDGGTASFRIHLIDHMSKINTATMNKFMKIELV